MLGFSRRSFARRPRWQASPRFIPAALAGVVLWLRADRGIQSNGSTISQWNDLSGKNFNFSQATPAKQPAYSQSTGPNGLPGLTFVAANSTALSASNQIITSTTNFTMICVQRWTSTATSGDSLTIGNSASFGVQSAGPSNDFVADGVADQIVAGANTNWQVWVGTVAAGPLWALRINGVNQAIAPNNSAPAVLQASSSIGAGTNGTAGLGNVVINEVIVVDRVLAAAEIAEIESYERLRTAIW